MTLLILFWAKTHYLLHLKNQLLICQKKGYQSCLTSGYMGEDVHINLLNPDQEECSMQLCPANLIYLDGSEFSGTSWLQSSGHNLNISVGKPCLKLKYGKPSSIEDEACSENNPYICEFDYVNGEIYLHWLKAVLFYMNWLLFY